MLTASAKLGAHIAMRNAGLPVKEYFTRAEMQRRYGEGRINQLIKSGRLIPHKDIDGNGRILYSETELLSLIF